MGPLTLSRHRHGVLIGGLTETAARLGCSDHFAVYGLGANGHAADPDDILVVHDFLAEQIDNNIGAYVADELLPLLVRSRPPAAVPGDGYAFSDHELFERCVGAIVRSIDGNERRAWHRFYDNTLAALRAPAAGGNGTGHADFIASFRAIYGRAAELASEVDARSILDVATCFGFLPLLLAGGPVGANGAGVNGAAVPRQITGCDLNPALVALAEDYRRHRRISGVRFIAADMLADGVAGALTADGSPFDLVMAVHFLEHLTADQTGRVLASLWALTGRRLVIAVPFEAEPDPRFGHRQAFDADSLAALAPPIGGRAQCFEHHGGWLVIDRVSDSGPGDDMAGDLDCGPGSDGGNDRGKEVRP